MNDKIMVSINCLVYNHEKYLRQCLDSLLAQKVNFKFEILIHDDASTDSSADIISEYEHNYPDIIKPIYQTENQYSQGVKITKTFQVPRMRGKYVATCEGDDFWCDKYKLQKQVDIMENYPDCHFCVHKVQGVKEDGTPTERLYPGYDIMTGLKDEKEFLQYVFSGYSFQTTCYFRRFEDYKELFNSSPDFHKIARVGDEPSLLFFATKGKSYYIDEVMSCYRLNSVGSWSSKQSKSKELQVKQAENMIDMYLLFDEYSNYKYTNMIKEKVSVYELTLVNIKNDTILKKLFFFANKGNRKLFKRITKKGKIKLIISLYAPYLFNIYSKLRGDK